ncbi:MAG TPA: CocE/NonD family hydrolase [Thermoanaerobaculia bacterium]|nr:CocE/NonD family hydrolase [Thermoanaerobaculia bacterium]
MNRTILSLAGLATFLTAIVGAAQQLDFPAAAAEDPAALSRAMPGLAKKVIADYRDDDRTRYLDNLFRLQMVAGDSVGAAENLARLRALSANGSSPRAVAKDVPYEIFLRARLIQVRDGSSFNASFARAFRKTFAELDDEVSALVARAMSPYSAGMSLHVPMEEDLRAELARRKGKAGISLAGALRLSRAYQVVETYRAMAPLTESLIAEDDHRRYVVERDLPVRAPGGSTVCALIVRPKASSGRLPALLEFTIYADANENLSEARRAASHGYAGVIGLTRGKGCSPDKPVPYRHDGADSAALIDWIAAQPWSDGRVGMYGGSYSGFTPWAAAKHMPKGLKAMMVGAPAAPGIDVPMEGNVFWNFVYPWPFYTTDNKTLDNATYSDSTRWEKLNHDWYVSGRPYRDLDRIDGTPNPVFDEWIAHPEYDAYWQSMIPYKKEFARIDIPVLTTAGYYYGGPGAAIYYFRQHHQYNPKAEHYLLIGPYDHFQAQRGTVGLLGGFSTVLAGYRLDPAAQIDMGELRYQWFDYVLRGGPRPALLKDNVNYEVTGANAWKHAASLAAMADHSWRLHLSAEKAGRTYRLSEKSPSDAVLTQTVRLADRTDADRKAPGGGVQDKAVDVANGLEFVSDPLDKPIELSGLFSGRLDFVTNKKDFDFEIDLYERTTAGDYIQLAPYWARASNVADPAHRRLLTPGKRQTLDFRSVRLMSRRLAPGSRVVAVLSVIKEPGRQINYGTGKDVSDETIADATEPLRIRWFGDSDLDLPVGR